MKLLLDTHLLLWAASDPRRLPKAARLLLQDTANELLFSAASLWEIAIKNSLGRADFRVDSQQLYRGLLNNGYTELPITGAHVVAACRLPTTHKDRFDRMLAAQANCEGITLLTWDRKLAALPGPVRVV